MIALARDRNWSWLRKARGFHLDRAPKSSQIEACRQYSHRTCPSSQHEGTSPSSAGTRPRVMPSYCNWLMLTILQFLPAAEVAHFAALAQTLGAAGGHLVGRYRRQRDQNRSALRRADSFRRGRSLDHYLSHVRPHLAQAASGNGLWLSQRGISACRAYDLPHHHRIDEAHIRHIPQPAFIPAHLCNEHQHRGPGGYRRRPGDARPC